MNANRQLDHTPLVSNGSVADRRAAALREEEERAARREERLSAQTSPLNDPQERIRIWEQLHALRLPLAAGHKLIRVIAAQTQLTVSQVWQEQHRRAGAAAQPQVAEALK